MRPNSGHVRQRRSLRTRRVAAGLAGVAQRIRGLEGVGRYGAALGAGVLTAGAMAPIYGAPFLFVALPVLIWLLDGAGPGRRGVLRALLLGEAFGFGFFLAGLYWIGNAFLVDAEAFGWMIPFVAVLLPVGLAFFPALALGLARLCWAPGWPRIVTFAGFWTAMEWIRGHVLTGFPWNLLGYAWGSVLPMLQSAAWWGIYGLSFVTALTAASGALAGDPEERVRGVDLRLAPAIAVIALFLLACAGQLRLSLNEPSFVEGVKLRIVHAAVDQRQIEDPAMREPIFARYMALTTGPGLDTVTHVIWPEAAVPFVISRDPAALDAIAQSLPPHTVLLTGAPRLQRVEGRAAPEVFNSLHALDGEGHILVTYDKAHLVPFGEYLPLEDWLKRLGLAQLAGNLGSFARGPGPRTLAVPGAPPFGVLICYEAIFPAAVLDPALRPGWLINVTDDSWFGTGAGPRQHFEAARLRAIEEGVPLVRAANKGVSAIIDPVGRLVAAASPAAVGVLDGALPQALPPTFYGRHGDRIPAILAFSALLLAFWRSRKRAIDKLVNRAIHGPLP